MENRPNTASQPMFTTNLTRNLAEAPSTAATRVGQQMGKYRLLQLLAVGGFAEVYLGEHIYLATQAAIKLLHAQITLEELEPFREEARMIASLRHPHIVNILDFDVQDGTPFLVMDYAPRGTLRQRHPRNAVLSTAIVAPYVKQIASALHHAHTHKLVHRDVKPENMLVNHNNEILLSDFGIAVALQTTHPEIERNVLGTVSYMSPEQFKGQAFPASDQYALATVIYEWLCGRCPFQGTITEIMAQHVFDIPAPLRTYNPHISEAVEEVVLKALEKDAKLRYATILDFANAFENACSQQAPSSQQPVSIRTGDIAFDEHAAETVRAFPVEHVQQDKRYVGQKTQHSRRALLAMLGGFAAVGLASGGILWFTNTHRNTRLKTPTIAPTASTPIGTLLLTYRGHTDTVSALAWSPGDTMIVSASKDKTARVWDAGTGADKLSYTGHSDVINAVAWAIDGTKVASGSDDKTVQIWTSNSNNQLVVYQGHSDVVDSISWSPDSTSSYIASASRDHSVRIWKVLDGSDVLAYTEHNDEVHTVAWSPTGKYIASGSEDKTVRVWHAPLNIVGTPDSVSPVTVTTFDRHSAGVRTVVWSPDEKYVASGGADNTVFVWYSLIGGNPTITYQGHNAPVNSVAWSPDGMFLASASDDGTVQIWQASDGKQLYVYNGHSTGGNPNPVLSVAWSSSGSAIASAGADKTVQIWHT